MSVPPKFGVPRGPSFALLAGFWLFTGWLASPVRGATISVTSLADSGPGSLRQAVADAVSGDDIDFQVIGTIFLSSGEIVIDKDLDILGPGMDQLTLNAGSAQRAFAVENVRACIQDLTIQRGAATEGGGIKNDGELSLLRLRVEFCQATEGGGGIVSFHSISLTDCTLSDNSSGTGAALLFGRETRRWPIPPCSRTMRRLGVGESSTRASCG